MTPMLQMPPTCLKQIPKVCSVLAVFGRLWIAGANQVGPPRHG